ncbi:MAG: glycosyltransferase family 2 protein [Thermoflexales bacterium]|nr:glycosyltransferase family 2 protein [Thermoflexales bacterium]
MQQDIFQQYYQDDVKFVDRYLEDQGRAVDVVIPVYNTNPLWRANLCSFYREIPIRTLLLGDGGCTDDTLDIARQFARVEVIDQRARHSLGYCIRELIEKVSTEWFIYLHSDVYLPPGWFDAMVRHQARFDWFECHRRKTVLVDFMDTWQNADERPYSGSQMGKKQAFEPFLGQVDDDYLYRNEDLVLREMVERSGGRYGRVSETFHYHQLVNKPGLLEPDFVKIDMTRAQDAAWIARTYDMQARGIIKYTQPGKKYLVDSVQDSLRTLSRQGSLDLTEFCAWTAKVNPAWLPYVKSASGRFNVVRRESVAIARSLLKILQAFIPNLKVHK